MQEARLDPAFTPFNNQGVAARSLEFDVFQRLWRDEATADLSRWGALSWRFGAKTGLTGQELLDQVESLDSVDVIFMNPFPRDEALYESSWIQGEISHPGLLELAREILPLVGAAADLVHEPVVSSDFSLCNYFVGNARFWSRYIPFIEAFLLACERELPPSTLEKLYSMEADWQGKHNGACYLPFIVERLFPLFMRCQGGALKGQQLRLPKREAQLSGALIELREMKDMAIRIRSEKIYNQWKQWRGAYLRANYSKEWCDRFLPLLEQLPKAI